MRLARVAGLEVVAERSALAGSALLTVIIGVMALLLAHSAIAWVLLAWFLDNLLVFTIGAFVPVGFNDGSTLIHWVRRR